ncbi:MAG: hypothetical protein DRN37_09545 [Thermoplasmata archaeon]|nr:MAG: hypothetical protein DRN37_09545 [Thermoplasmata archaeon]
MDIQKHGICPYIPGFGCYLQIFPKVNLFHRKSLISTLCGTSSITAELPPSPAAQVQAVVRLKVLAGGVIGKKLQKNKKRG